ARLLRHLTLKSSVEGHENPNVAGFSLGQNSTVVQLASMIPFKNDCAFFDRPDLGIVRNTLRKVVPDEIHVLSELRIIRYAFGLSGHRAHDEWPAEQEQPKGGDALFAERISRCDLTLAAIGIEEKRQHAGIKRNVNNTQHRSE